MKSYSLLFFFILLSSTVHAQLRLGIESGFAFTQYNDVRVPNAEQERGTLFSLKNDFTPDKPAIFFRLEGAYLINGKHTLELVAAPLQLDYQDSTLDSIEFAGSTFKGAGVDGRYEFNTYRFSYRYRLVQKPQFSFDLGATLLVRDARIALTQNDFQAEDVDLGFVPLISFELNYAPDEKLSLLLKGDALVGPQGRAEDIFVGILYQVFNEHLQLKAGYRLIEGGADVDQVYNFAFVHFIDLGVVYTL
jgi:hypothetical protein